MVLDPALTTVTAHELDSRRSWIIHPEVADALAAGDPVVALESTIISHGLPRPENLRVAQQIESVVRSRGAIPATIAIIDGTVCVGLRTDSNRFDGGFRNLLYF